MRVAVPLLVLGISFGGSGLSALISEGSSPAKAAAPCVPHTNTEDELSFLNLLQGWRDQNIPGSHPLAISATLNAAAAGYAQFLANTPGAGGHYADGADWVVRASNCGYSSNGFASAGGEGLAVVEAGSAPSVPPQTALSIMTAHGGSGVNIPASVGLPVKCVGIARASSPSGGKVAWVALLFAINGSCPQAVNGGGGGGGQPTVPAPSSTSTPTSSLPTFTPFPTNTPAATPTPTPPPDPRPFKAVLVQIANDGGMPIAGVATPTPAQPPVSPTVPSAPTPTPTVPVTAACNGATATVTALDKLGEHVYVSGSGLMTGWYLVSENGNQRFDFPAGFILNGQVTIVSGRNPFANSATALWWVASTVWNNTDNDDALLYDCTGRLVHRFDDGD